MEPTPINAPRSIKRVRRGTGAMDAIRQEIKAILSAENPMTVRQLFYQLVSRGAIEKTEAQYKGTVIRLLGDMRRDGEVPFGWIADSTRWMRKPKTFGSMERALVNMQDTFRRSIWDNQEVYTEIWLEKDALSGVLYNVTASWDVPLMVTRGYPSISFLHGAAEAIEELGKPTYIYYFGDWDPSGRDITRATEAGLREFAPKAEIHFERVAVTEQQIEEFNLPMRPTKETDSRAKGHIGGSVEVDAIPIGELRTLAENCIIDHIDLDAYRRLKDIERADRQILDDWIRAFVA
jgi:hypothetical protein